MFSTIDMRDTLGNPQPKEKPHSIFIDHFSKVSRSKLARAKSASRSHTKKQTGPKKRRSPAPPPELVHDNAISEESTPVSTPTHPEFDFRIVQGQVDDKKLVFFENVDPPASPLANKSKNVNTNPKVWRPCPAAPRIDTGTFDNTSHPDTSLDSSTSFSNDSMDIPFPLDRQMLQNLDAPFSREIGVDPRLLQCPPAPRPDIGSWSYTDARGLGPYTDARMGPYTDARMDPYTDTRPGPFLPGVPAWMNAQAYRLPIPAAGPTTPAWARLRAESNSFLNPSLGWNMGHGLDLHAIADIPGPSLGENMFMEVECEQCLMGLFPSVPRPPRCVASPALAWTHGMKFDSGRVLVQEAGMTRMFEHSQAVGVGALGYGMRGHDSVRVDVGQSVWTRPVEPVPIVLTETAVDHSGLLPPIELDRRRVGV